MSGERTYATMDGNEAVARIAYKLSEVKAVFDKMQQEHPKNHFTVGIVDDADGSTLAYDAEFSIEPEDAVRAVFYGLGSDGTVGANKSSIKIIGENTPNYALGALRISHFTRAGKREGALR